MALVKCVECKKKISSKAKVCPQCGKENPTPLAFGCAGKLIFLLVFFIVIISLINFSSDDPKSKTSIRKTELKQKAKPKKSIKFLSEKEKILYGKVRKIPAVEVEKNRDGYNKLLELNPSSTLYKNKLKHYSKLSHNKEMKREKIKHNQEVKKANRRSAEELIRTLIQNDAISIDSVNYRVYVDPGFWGVLDYGKKETFCFALQTVYPRHSIVNKYSGKKLADRNLLGETRVLR